MSQVASNRDVSVCRQGNAEGKQHQTPADLLCQTYHTYGNTQEIYEKWSRPSNLHAAKLFVYSTASALTMTVAACLCLKID